jgi:hypothetical protein
MSLALGILAAVIVVLGGFALWIKIAIWIMGLGVDDDNKINWPWSKDD